MKIRPALGCGTCIDWHVLGRIDIPCNRLGASFPSWIMSSLTPFFIPTFKRIYQIRDGRTVEEAGEGRAL